MDTNTTTNINEIENNDKISVADYLNNKELIKLTYLPFDTKMRIVSGVIMEVINAIGGINTPLLRRISTEVFIESITNIDMNIEDDNGLKGFDQLCYHGELENLQKVIGREYNEFQTILDERIADYIRTETNPAITINKIYEQLTTYANTALNYIQKRVQDNAEELSKQLMPLIEKVGVTNEG